MSDKAFQALLKSLSSAERETLLKTAVSYGLTPDDPAWLILAINHTGLLGIEKAIEQLQNQRKIELEAFKSTAEHVASSAMMTAANANIDRISEQLAKTAQGLYRSRELKATVGWVVVSAIIGIVFFVTTNVISYQFIRSTLFQQAKQEAYDQVVNEAHRANWANTETGKVAYALSQVTNIHDLATCQKKQSGWRINESKNKFCFPHSKNNTVTGWQIPD